MKTSHTQFGTRENTASSRQHASRSAVESYSKATCIEDGPETQQPSLRNQRPVPELENPLHAASERAATVGERRDENHLLSVREVAELLQVPVSWVYGRMRKRSIERLPGYRLGKYWRFRADEVWAWVECHREESHAS